MSDSSIDLTKDQEANKIEIATQAQSDLNSTMDTNTNSNAKQQENPQNDVDNNKSSSSAPRKPTVEETNRYRQILTEQVLNAHLRTKNVGPSPQSGELVWHSLWSFHSGDQIRSYAKQLPGLTDETLNQLKVLMGMEFPPEKFEELKKITGVAYVFGMIRLNATEGVRISFPIPLTLLEPNKCWNCGKDAGTKRCGRCNVAAYCSPDCQKKGWTDGHQVVCKPWALSQQHEKMLRERKEQEKNQQEKKGQESNEQEKKEEKTNEQEKKEEKNQQEKKEEKKQHEKKLNNSQNSSDTSSTVTPSKEIRE